MKKSLLVLGLLFTSSVMAAKSQFPCNTLLFNGQSLDKEAQLIVCESKKRIALTLINLKTDNIVIDQRVPFDQSGVFSKNTRTRVFVWAEDDEDGKSVVYTEIRGEGKVGRVVVIDPEGKNPTAIPMAKPSTDHLDRSLEKYGAEVGDLGLQDE